MLRTRPNDQQESADSGVLLFGQHPTFATVINLALASYSAC